MLTFGSSSPAVQGTVGDFAALAHGGAAVTSHRYRQSQGTVSPWSPLPCRKHPDVVTSPPVGAEVQGIHVPVP